MVEEDVTEEAAYRVLGVAAGAERCPVEPYQAIEVFGDERPNHGFGADRRFANDWLLGQLG
jgi:hypothetical protein